MCPKGILGELPTAAALGEAVAKVIIPMGEAVTNAADRRGNTWRLPTAAALGEAVAKVIIPMGEAVTSAADRRGNAWRGTLAGMARGEAGRIRASAAMLRFPTCK